MRCVRDGIDIGKLTGRFADGAEVLRRFSLGQQAILLDEDHVDEAQHCGKQERQLVGAVCAALVQRFEHTVVGKGAGGVEQAVGHGQGEGQEALGILAVALRLPGGAQLGVLRGVDHAKADRAHADEDDRAKGERGIILAADEQQRHHGDERTRRIADRRRDGQLNVAEAEIAERHRADVQQRHGQIGPDNRPADLRAADENFERGVKTHHGTDGNDHLEVGEMIVLPLTADLGKQVAAAPAEQRDQRKPEPHIELLNSFVLLNFLFRWKNKQYAGADGGENAGWSRVFYG